MVRWPLLLSYFVRHDCTDSSTEGGQAAREPIGGSALVPQTHQTFALVIGINEYQWVPNECLRGAVRDADNFENYLLECRGVPKDNIINLRDGQATRSAIIQKFRELENNPRIIPGEVAIIIYFAGHGAIAHKPKTWKNWETPNGNVEMLCPADINAPEGYGKKIEGIPDRTIGRLLLDLSKAKGNNITLILDCCHAAGMNRGHNTSESRVRSFGSIQELSPTCDEHIYSSESSTRLDKDRDILGFSNSFFRSHVLLAACGSEESAREQDREGIFTKVLLRALKESVLEDLPPTYLSLIQSLRTGIQSQKPQLDGKYVRRRLFDCWQEPASSSMIPCRKGDMGRDLVLHAGLLHGIKKDSIFEIFDSDSHNPKFLARSTVTKVEDAVSYLTPTPSDSNVFTLNTERSPWYARLWKAFGPPLNTYCNNPGVLDRILADSNESRLIACVIRVESPDDADLCLKVDAKVVCFDRGKRVNVFLSFFPRYSSCPVHAQTDIRDFLNRYAHFTSHLTRQSLFSIEDFVRIEMKKVVKDGPSQWRALEGEVALKKVGNSDLVEVVVDTSLPLEDRRNLYGFTIYNKRGTDLYVNVLYFDASKSVIDIWYSSQKSQTGDSADPCLRKGSDSKLTLGHGNSAMQPLGVGVPDGQDEDICFIKFYVTTKAVDIGPIEQPEFPPADGKSRSAWLVPIETFASSSLNWASKTITVISKRSKNQDSIRQRKMSHQSLKNPSCVEGYHLLLF
ncbi:hypothetical protein DFS33DRAFT_1061251 [Desarmillaria ectypa]|nr:hypothetical protein DFS33DRAFT_1061251 [Desarmillaria ectypa]